MEFLNKIIIQLNQLTTKEQERFIVITLASVALLMGGLVYFIYQKSTDLVTSIKKVETLANKATQLLQDCEKLQKEENRIEDMLEKQRDFNINSYFEQFCKRQSLNPTSEWSTSTIQINQKFDEITLQATFKDLTTEKLVKILEEIDKQEIIYIKSLLVKTEKEKKRVTVDITIATKRSK